MHPTCPQCFSQLASSEVGNLCVNCGYLQRRHHNHTPGHDEDTTTPPNHHAHTDHVTPGNLEAPRGLDDLLFTHQPERPRMSEPASEHQPHTPPQATEAPRIINHRSSSQYRRRLEKRLQTLHTPELESAIEPDSSLEQPNQLEPTAASAPIPEAPMQQSPPPSYSTDLKEAEDSDVVEVNEPHRPSPYMLNMGGSEVLENPDKPEPQYHSPLHDTPPSTHLPEKNTASSSEKSVPAGSDAAMTRADALLAAAATPQKDSAGSRMNYIIVAITIVLLLGLGSFLGFNLLKAPQNSTKNQSSTNSSSNTPSTSPTPSNLTEAANRDEERKNSLNTIAIALAAYKKSSGNYPVGNDIQVLTALTSSNPPYLREIKNDPLSNEETGVIIKYGYNSDGTKFTLTASLENKQDSDAVNGLYVVKSP